jgi:putative hydrolase of the HAD superfamily
MPVKAVLFDMFDTLMLIERKNEFYSPSLLRMYKFLNANGINVPFEKFNAAYIVVRERLNAKANQNLEEPHFNVRISETLKRLGYNFEVSNPLVAAASGEFCEEFMTFVHVDEDAEAMLKLLRRKYKLGIISNFAIPECVFKLLKASELDRLFDAVVISAAINRRKPSPDIFDSALKILGISSAEAVFVGDTVDADIEGAKAAGMKAIYLERREQRISANSQPDQTIKSLKELPERLRTLE